MRRPDLCLATIPSGGKLCVKVIPNARLCKALLDRITDRAHIIETGADSFRFRRTVEKGRAKTTG